MFITWGYYSATHNKVSENDFTTIATQAEACVRSVVGAVNYAEITADTFGYNILLDCICNVMDGIVDSKASAVGKGISSVSNDGYSESYTVQTEGQARDELHSSIRSMLSGTGIVGAY